MPPLAAATSSSATVGQIATAAALHSAALLLLLIGMGLMHFAVPPFSRRFFCDDQSISYPAGACTVPYYVAAPVGVIAAWLAVIAAEWGSRDRRHLRGGRLLAFTSRLCPLSESRAAYTAACLHGVYCFCLGLAACDFLMSMAKNVFGRHRPFFLAACRPQLPGNGVCNASVAYSPAEVCHPVVSLRQFQDAQRSFPSGHSSFGLYCATFIVLYLQRRGSSRGSGGSWSTIPRLTAQFAAAVAGLYMAYSRVPDYKHHWSDVLAGGLLGTVLAFLAVSAVPVEGEGDAYYGKLVDSDGPRTLTGVNQAGIELSSVVSDRPVAMETS